MCSKCSLDPLENSTTPRPFQRKFINIHSLDPLENSTTPRQLMRLAYQTHGLDPLENSTTPRQLGLKLTASLV